MAGDASAVAVVASANTRMIGRIVSNDSLDLGRRIAPTNKDGVSSTPAESWAKGRSVKIRCRRRQKHSPTVAILPL